MQRRSLIRLFAATCAGFSTLGALAQAFPTKPITVVVPYAVGGTTDIVARLVGQQIGNGLGQPIVVDNKTGGGGTIGWGTVARAPADGHTLLTTEMSMTIAPSIVQNLPFDANKGFSHISVAASAPHVLVINPNVPAKTIKEFIALAKASPGKLNYGSGGNGTNTHLGGELFKREAGVSLAPPPAGNAGLHQSLGQLGSGHQGFAVSGAVRESTGAGVRAGSRHARRHSGDGSTGAAASYSCELQSRSRRRERGSDYCPAAGNSHAVASPCCPG